MKPTTLISSALILAAMVVAPGCKPTEKNYKAAYDAALAKREAEKTDPDMDLPQGGYHKIGDPEKKTVNGKSYSYLFQRVKPLQDGVSLLPYNVAVSVYKMPTNCEAQSEDLRGQGYDAFGVKTADDRYYVIAGSYPSLEEAAAAVDSYMEKNKEAVYVGLPGVPLILQSR